MAPTILSAVALILARRVRLRSAHPARQDCRAHPWFRVARLQNHLGVKQFALGVILQHTLLTQVFYDAPSVADEHDQEQRLREEHEQCHLVWAWVDRKGGRDDQGEDRRPGLQAQSGHSSSPISRS